MTPPLEDHLHRLADDLAAPPTPETRAAVHRRAGTLRRRRRVGTAIGGGVAAVALVAGVAALQRDDPADVEMGPAETVPGPAEPDGGAAEPVSGALPVVAVEGEGWEVVEAGDQAVAATEGAVVQVFRRQGDLTGPSAFLLHWPASDTVVPEAGDETVPVNGTDGYLREAGVDAYVVDWNPPGTDSHASLATYGLSRDQVLDLAAGLRSKDGDIASPPAPDDTFGFDATALPAGIEEEPLAAPPTGPTEGRRVVFERDLARVEITVTSPGDRAFESGLGQLLTTAGEVTEVRVLARMAVLVERSGGTGSQWNLTWQDAGGAAVDVHITGVESVIDVVDGIRVLPADDWPDLVARAG